MSSTVISFRVDEATYRRLQNVWIDCIDRANAAGDTVQAKVLHTMSLSTFARIVFDSGLSNVVADLNRGGTTTSPMGAK